MPLQVLDWFLTGSVWVSCKPVKVRISWKDAVKGFLKVLFAGLYGL